MLSAGGEAGERKEKMCGKLNMIGANAKEVKPDQTRAAVIKAERKYGERRDKHC